MVGLLLTGGITAMGNQSSAVTETGEPLALTGRLFDESGQSLQFASVQVAALPVTPTEGVVTPVTFDRAKTNDFGHFLLEGVPDGVRRFQDGAGAVVLEFTGTVGLQAVHQIITAFPPTASVDKWTTEPKAAEASATAFAIAGGPVLHAPRLRVRFERSTIQVRSRSRNNAAGRFDRQATAFEADQSTTFEAVAPSADVEPTPEDPTLVSVGEDFNDPTEPWVDPDEPPAGTKEGPGLDADALAVTTDCGTSTTTWVQTNDFRRVQVPMQRLASRANSRQTYLWDTTRRTSLEVGYTGAGGNYGGGLRGSWNQRSSLGMEFAIGDQQQQLLRVEWVYRKFRKWCVNDNGVSRRLNVWRWDPWRITGGSSRPHSEPHWGCAKTVTMSTKTWVARESRVRWNGNFSIAGIGLDATQENSDIHRLTIYPQAGERYPQICGSNTWPVDANRVKERVG